MRASAEQLMRADLQLACWVIVAVALLLGPVALLKARRAGLSGAVGWHIKPSHALPALIQTLLFAYWALYYRSLASHVPGFALQLVLAYTLDGLLSLARSGRWRVGLAPVPLVFSLNLFAIFLHGELRLSLLAVTLAVASKHFIRRSGADGRHIFNPSGFGIAVVGVLNIIWPTLGDGDIAHEFNLPPNMAELIVLLALVVQARIAVVLITLGAAAAMLLTFAVTGYGGFAPQWAPVTLVIVLLMTDPATSARTPTGKLLFGMLAGALMQAMAFALPDHPDFFYAKVLPIPLCNFAAPACDRVAARLTTAMPRLLEALSPRRNRLHVGVWLLCFSALIAVDKRPQMGPGHPEPELHAFNRTPFVKFGPDGSVECADNPLYCEPFSFIRETKLWLR